MSEWHGNGWRVICGDCLAVMRGMDAGSVDAVVTDPPYNNGMPYAGYDDNRTDYREWCTAWFAECRRIARRVVVFPGHGNLWMWGAMEQPWGVGIWYKPGNPQSSVLGWVTWEPWLYWTKDYRALGGPDSIRATVSKQSDVGNHPCPKPLPLLEELVQKITKPDEVVLDCFAGSGTTGVAALRTGRRFVGIEISEQYCEIAVKRLQQEERRLALPQQMEIA